jgi:hypothetical protein
MAALRQRLELACSQAAVPPSRTPVITTLRGHGYRLDLTLTGLQP